MSVTAPLGSFSVFARCGLRRRAGLFAFRLGMTAGIVPQMRGSARRFPVRPKGEERFTTEDARAQRIPERGASNALTGNLLCQEGQADGCRDMNDIACWG